MNKVPDIDWSQYPTLAAIFEDAPRESLLWLELKRIVDEQRSDARASALREGLEVAQSEAYIYDHPVSPYISWEFAEQRIADRIQEGK